MFSTCTILLAAVLIRKNMMFGFTCLCYLVLLFDVWTGFSKIHPLKCDVWAVGQGGVARHPRLSFWFTFLAHQSQRPRDSL